jgi:hypothetical protein
VNQLPSWLLQVYEMSDPAAQQSAASLLSSMPGLIIDARTCDRGSYVIVESADATQAMSVYELVVMADPHAELIHSTTSQRGAQAVRDRIAEAPAVSDGDLLGA